MSEFSFGTLLQKAKDSGAVSDAPPDGHYTLKVINVNAGDTAKGFPRFGVQYQVQDGPEKGKSFWDNVSFSDNPTNVAISFRYLRDLGLDSDFFEANPSKEAVKERILQSGLIEADVKFVVKNGYDNVQLRKVKRLGTLPPGVGAPATATATATAPAPAPAPSGVTPSF